MLEVRVLGGLELWIDGVARELPASSRARALLAWLALHPGTHPRGELAGRLRPDVLDESARTSLRQAAWALRRTLGEAGRWALVGTRDRLGLAGPDVVRVDLADFRRLVRAGDLRAAIELADGELLAGLEEDWVDSARAAHRRELAEVLERLAAEAEGAGRLEESVAWTQRRSALEPLSESPARDLVRRLAAAGDRAAALATFERFRERLRRELQVVPSATTRALVAEIRAGVGATAAGSSPTATGQATRPAAPAPALPAPLRAEGPFVGRRDELERIAPALSDARSGTPRVVLLRGEPGIGKTRLAAEVAREVVAEGGHVLYGRCEEELLVPHQPFVEALERWLAAIPAERRGAVLREHGDELALLVPRLHETAARAHDPETARWQMFEATRAVLAGAATESVVLLVLDDLHWADAPTLALLRHLSRHLADARLLLLGTYRDTEVDDAHPLAATLAELRRHGPLTRVSLQGLSPEAIGALVGASGDALAPDLHARTGGNPFFVGELLRDAAGGGSGVADAVPEGVTDVITRRLARLGEGVRELLLVGALLGPEFELAELAAASGRDPDALLTDLEVAVSAGLARESGDAVGRYAFRHALIAETLVTSASATRRALLHRCVADALAAHHAATPDRVAARLARHYLAAARADAHAAEQALRWARASSAQAAARLAYDQAAEHLEQALSALAQLPDDPPRRAELLLELGDAHNRAGAREPAREALRAAADAARAAGAPELLAAAALGYGGLGTTVTALDPVHVELLERALAACGGDAPALRAQLLARQAVAVYYADRELAEVLSEEAVRLARELGDLRTLAAALNARRVAIWSPDRTEERVRVAEEIVGAAERAGDVEMGLLGRNWRLLDQLETWRIAEARAEIDDYARIADDLRLPHYRWWVPLWRGTIALLEGRYDDLERLNAEALTLGTQAQDPNADPLCYVQRVTARAERLDFDDTDIAWAERMAGATSVEAAWTTWVCLLCAERGEEARARELVDELARDDFAAIPTDANWHCLCDLADAVATLGDAERARALYPRARRYARLNPVVARAVACYGSVHLQLGRLAATFGELARAEQHFATAAAQHERFGAAPRLALTRLRHAEALVTAGGSARQRAGPLLDAVERSAQELGLPAYAARATDLRAR